MTKKCCFQPSVRTRPMTHAEWDTQTGLMTTVEPRKPIGYGPMCNSKHVCQEEVTQGSLRCLKSKPRQNRRLRLGPGAGEAAWRLARPRENGAGCLAPRHLRQPVPPHDLLPRVAHGNRTRTRAADVRFPRLLRDADSRRCDSRHRMRQRRDSQPLPRSGAARPRLLGHRFGLGEILGGPHPPISFRTSTTTTADQFAVTARPTSARAPSFHSIGHLMGDLKLSKVVIHFRTRSVFGIGKSGCGSRRPGPSSCCVAIGPKRVWVQTRTCPGDAKSILCCVRGRAALIFGNARSKVF
jgi:hypothetical protein